MHSEITLMYLILIPVILNHLVNLMISFLYKINHRLARKKKNNIILLATVVLIVSTIHEFNFFHERKKLQRKKMIQN